MPPVKPSSGLTAQQIQSYCDDGFIVIADFFPPEEIETLREAEASPAIQSGIEESGGNQQRTVHLLELTERHPAFLELARDSKILACIRPLLGEDIQLQHSKLATKAVTKGTGAFGWHQDHTYYPHSNTSLLSVFIYLDDATPENGCMSMVRGSHRLGALDHVDPVTGNFTGGCRESRYWEENPGNVVAISPRAGAISIHHSLTLHGSPANLSGKPRRGVVFSYRADDAYQFGGMCWRDTGLVVSGRRRGVVRCEANTWRLPLRPVNGRKDFGSAHHQTGDWAQALNETAGA